MKRCKLKGKFAGVAALATAMMVGISPISAYAMVEPVEEEETVSTEIPEEEETVGPLTPDGNLTLVDDYGSGDKTGKQFITVVTKAGNYFYIIIDRDDEGNETVHFLNMVDESDLLTLMDDEEAKQYVESITEEPETDTKPETTVEPVEKTDETEVSEDTGGNKSGILLLLVLAVAGGAGGFVFRKKNKEKEMRNSGPDPDFDYIEDEEDYLAGLADADEENAAECDEDIVDDEE